MKCSTPPNEYMRLYQQYRHITFLNGFDIGEKRIYKYMNVERVVELLNTGRMSYVEPSKWFDPFESLFYNADYSNLNYCRPKVFCSCFTTKFSNEASWVMYTHFKQGIASRSIRLKINPIVYFDLLESFGRWSGGHIYIGEADYSLAEPTIKALHKKSSKKHAKYFNAFDQTKFINLLRVKRKAFEYEKEVRVFIVAENNDYNPQYIKDILNKEEISMGYDMTLIKYLIEDFTISPLCTDLEASMIASVIDKFGLKNKCSKSRLYIPISQIKIEI